MKIRFEKLIIGNIGRTGKLEEVVFNHLFRIVIFPDWFSFNNTKKIRFGGDHVEHIEEIEFDWICSQYIVKCQTERCFEGQEEDFKDKFINWTLDENE